MDEIEILPKHWQVKKLQDVGEIIAGGTPSTKVTEYWNGDINWITPADLSGYKNKIIYNGRKSITRSGLQNSSARLMPKGAVLFSSRAPIGYTVIAGNDVCTNQGFKSIVPNKLVSSDFLFYYLKSSKDKAENVASGTTFKEISKKAFSKLEIPIPPLPEQHAIVAKIEELLSDLDNGVQQLRTAQQQLKIYRQSLLKAAFEGEATHSWDQQPLKNICDQKRGVSYGVIKLGKDDKNGIPCLRTSNVRQLSIDVDSVKKISKNISNNYKRTLLVGGEVLVNIRGSLGGVAVVPVKFRGWNVSREIAVVPLLDHINSQFIALQIASIKSQNWLKGVTKGIAYLGINLSDLRNLPIVLPSLKEQQSIVTELESKLTVCDNIKQTINRSLLQAESLRQSILKKAFEGRLVPHNGNSST